MKGLYIHIPFCVQKCKYCDFVSFSCSNESKDIYLKALSGELKAYKGTSCDTIFIGGGTPTSLTTEQLKLLLENVHKYFKLTSECEFTVEANPKTLDRDKLEILKRGGVNRLSIGVQSFNDDELKVIGRIHTACDAIETINIAREMGFENISIDLMSAIPFQTMDSFKKNIEAAILQNTQHISCYSLILEEGTPLYEQYNDGKLQLADEDEEREMYEYACKALEKAGYIQYEISNFAKPGRQSRHNIKYWQCDEYIGAGLAAHSYLDGERFSNTAIFDEYIAGNYTSGEREVLSKEAKMSEFMFMGLRMSAGISEKKFKNRFNAEIDDIFEKPLLKFEKMGMLERENGRILLTHKALSLSNQIMCEFIL